MTAFQVQLDAFHGPLDLLLYLVKKEELPIAELPLADVAAQFLDYVAVLERLDPDAVGEFLDVASLLLEIKSRSVLPTGDDPAMPDPLEEAVIESPGDLVERLLEFKEYRDAATRLESLRLDWGKRHTRAAGLAPRGRTEPSGAPIEGVELWDLVSAFARVMHAHRDPEPEPTIYYDETPVHLYMERIDTQLRATDRPIPFENLFPGERVHRSTLVGVFLAVLELIRYGHASAIQDARYGPITLAAGAVPFATQPPPVSAAG